ncbi:LptF/LptG family permease [Gluconobacter wancherniae]|nr:LptF/LptG family permease [Gluconobacter wancherniae]GBR63365.1 transporter YjgP/YjgQ [Gluconobacter wancherniae NBRC 103581]
MSTTSMPRHVLLKAMSFTQFGRIIICSGVLVALLEILSMLDQATPILSRHLGIRGILTYAILHLPALAVETMPLAVLIGTLFMLTRMSLSSEMSALRAAGLSTFGLYKMLLPATLAAGMLAMIGQYWIVPKSELALATWWNRTDPTADSPDSPETNILWFRAGPKLVRIGHIAQGGASLRDVTIYHRDTDGLLTGTEHTDTLHYSDGIWHPTGPKDLTLSSDKSFIRVSDGDSNFPLPATPRQVIALMFPQAFFTPGQIGRILHHGAPASLARATYRMALFAGLFLPLQMAVVVLLALPVIYIPPRAGMRNPLPVYALSAGLCYIILQGMISALGNAGTISALVATSIGPLLGCLLGLSWVLRMEER